jgi:hypothetical protein
MFLDRGVQCTSLLGAMFGAGLFAISGIHDQVFTPVQMIAESLLCGLWYVVKGRSIAFSFARNLFSLSQWNW